MKKFVYILVAISACIFVSCQKEAVKEIAPSQPTMKTVTITATVGEQTKTAYGTTGAFSWDKDDEISVLCDDDNFYTFKADASGTSTTFTGSIPNGVKLGDYAFYPADPNHTKEGLLFNIPESKDLTSHPSDEMPMIGDKGTDDAYSFMHCSGVAKFTVTNIPDTYTSAEISITSPSLKLSGQFGVFTSSGYWRYNPKAASTDSEKTFTRKVVVSNNTATVFVPYASGSEWWGKNTISVTGYNASNSPTVLVSSKTMSKSIGTIERAHVLPIKPLVLNNLSSIDWTASGIATSTLDPTSSKKCLSELKVTSDDYYMYARVTAPVEGFTGDYLDVYLSDGSSTGTHYAISDSNQYWTTSGETVYCEEHKGVVTASSVTMTFNGKSIDTSVANDSDNIYWYFAFPRDAHPLLSSTGTVYVAFMLWNGWSCVGAIPTRYTAMLPVTLQ